MKKDKKADCGVMEDEAMQTQCFERKEDIEFVKQFRDYFRMLQEMPQEAARKEAQDALIRTGVIDRDGKPKKNIVSWE